MGVVLAAGLDSGIYKLLLFLHVLTVVVAFAPLFVQPLLFRQLSRKRRGDLPALADGVLVNNRRVYAPALIIAGFFGILLIATSDKVWEFSQVWVSLAFLVWIGMNGVLHAVQIPAQRKLAAGDRTATQRLDRADGILAVLFVIMLVLMVWKPGL
jgi:uncharacterized membrane protein